MPDRKSGKNTEQKTEITLRRSSRFLHLDPATPELFPNKIRPVHLLFSPTHISTSKSSNNREVISEILVETKKGLGKSAENETRKEYMIEKKVTRSSVRQIGFVNSPVTKCGLVSDSERRVRHLSKTGKGKVYGKLSKKCVGDVEKRVNSGLQKECVVEKRVTRSAFFPSKCCNSVPDCVSEEGLSEKVSILQKEGDERGSNPPKGCIGSIRKRVTRSSSRGETNDLIVKGNGKLTKDAGLSRADESECDSESESQDSSSGRKKRKKKHPVAKESEIVRGWTEEQESSLRKAYFTAKATPHFWKKVAKMVPGKSAVECFNRIHKDLSTPPQPHTRSRAKTKPSPIPLSATDLLSPATTKRKRLRSTKKSCLLAQKTVRQLLQKKQKEDEDYEPDFFSILEKNTKLSPLNLQEGISFSSPPPNCAGPCRFRKCMEISSSSGQNRPLSRLSSSNKAAFVSPPVLKQVKNKALHEKYIDQLHCRDAKRKRELRKTQKRNVGKNVEKVKVRAEAVKVAKDALMFEAQDAIKQFQNLQSSVLEETDDGYLSNEEDDNDEL